MSALPPKATSNATLADIGLYLLDRLVGAAEQRQHLAAKFRVAFSLKTVTLPQCFITVLMGRGAEIMQNTELGFVPSTKENVTVRSRRRRPREYLTEAEIDKLMDAARDNRQGHRDATAILGLQARFTSV
jgi:hypothetical protein